MIRVETCRDVAQFEAAAVLLDQMLAWDIRETEAATGLSGSDVIATFYGDTSSTLLTKFVEPKAAMFLALWSGRPVGFAAFSDCGSGIAELEKIFVDPAARGLGIGKALMSAVLDRISHQSFTKVRLMTAEFMASAISLYESFGFRRCAPFTPMADQVQKLTVFMERPIQLLG